MMKYTSGIVTFNPEISTLRRNVEALLKQQYISRVIIVDNASDNQREIEQLAAGFGDIVLLIKNKRNLGIAAALNTIFRESQVLGAGWVLTCDQDSVVPDNLMESFIKHTEDDEIAVISPNIYDINLKMEYGHAYADDTKTTLVRCITSGSLNRVDAWEKAGGFDEFFFIDWVDYDFCFRIRKNGYKIVLDNNVVLEHAIGKSKRVRFLGTYYNVHNQAASRHYYFCRNRLLFDYKYYGKLTRGGICSLSKQILFVLLYEKTKFRKISACCHGIADGLKSRKRYEELN